MNGITYTKCGDYYYPDLFPPEQTEAFIGKYGLLRKTYLKSHRKVLYLNLLTSGKLHEHLVDIDRQANDRLELLVRQLAESEGVTENLKTENQMAWVGRMNNIRARAEEIVNTEIIYT